MHKPNDLKNRIKAKVRSEKGSSLVLALFIFMICMTISSVLLAAGTASAGRLSESKKRDGKYYSLQSATKLLEELVDEKGVSISLNEVKTVKTITTVKDNGETESGSSDTSYTYGFTIDDHDYGDALFGTDGSITPSALKFNEMSMIEASALYLLCGDLKGAQVLDMDSLINGTSFPALSGDIVFSPFSVKVSSGDTDMEDLTAYVTCTLRASGSLEFVITDKDTNDAHFDKADALYKKILIFRADYQEPFVNEHTDTETEDISDHSAGAAGGAAEGESKTTTFLKVERTEMTKEVNIKWTLSEIRDVEVD